VLDGLHTNIEEPDGAAAVGQSRVAAVNFQAADSNRLPPGRGSIDLGFHFRALESIRYRGPMGVELVLTVHGTPPFSAAAVGGKVRAADYERPVEEALNSFEANSQADLGWSRQGTDLR
jgi:sugar phosphate isomerase/epimerase